MSRANTSRFLYTSLGTSLGNRPRTLGADTSSHPQDGHFVGYGLVSLAFFSAGDRHSRIGLSTLDSLAARLSSARALYPGGASL